MAGDGGWIFVVFETGECARVQCKIYQARMGVSARMNGKNAEVRHREMGEEYGRLEAVRNIFTAHGCSIEPPSSSDNENFSGRRPAASIKTCEVETNIKGPC